MKYIAMAGVSALVFVFTGNGVFAAPAAMTDFIRPHLQKIAVKNIKPSELASYRALYRMKLSSGYENSKLTSADGLMSYTFNDQCDGWSSETNVALNLGYADGRVSLMNWSFADWENKNGLKYRFKGLQKQDGQIVERINGVVTRKSVSDISTVKFTAPEKEPLTLPGGTVFPTRFLLDIFTASRLGKNNLRQTVFDGAGLENPYDVNAVMVSSSLLTKRPKPPTGKNVQATADIRYPVQLAYFPKSSPSPTPEYELMIDFQNNGIARFMRQDFGDFALDLFVDKIELLPTVKCKN